MWSVYFIFTELKITSKKNLWPTLKLTISPCGMSLPPIPFIFKYPHLRKHHVKCQNGYMYLRLNNISMLFPSPHPPPLPQSFRSTLSGALTCEIRFHDDFERKTAPWLTFLYLRTRTVSCHHKKSIDGRYMLIGAQSLDKPNCGAVYA